MKKQISKILKKSWSAWMFSLLGLSVVLTIIGDTKRAIAFSVIYLVCVVTDELADIEKGINIIWYRMYLRNKHDGIE